MPPSWNTFRNFVAGLSQIQWKALLNSASFFFQTNTQSLSSWTEERKFPFIKKSLQNFLFQKQTILMTTFTHTYPISRVILHTALRYGHPQVWVHANKTKRKSKSAQQKKPPAKPTCTLTQLCPTEKHLHTLISLQSSYMPLVCVNEKRRQAFIAFTLSNISHTWLMLC